jgi:hypothetical protein
MHALRGLFAEIALQNSPQFIKADAPACQLLAITILRQIRLASKHPRTRAHRLVKGLMLEGMQRVVMNENADRSLRWQQMRCVLNLVRKLLAGVGHAGLCLGGCRE